MRTLNTLTALRIQGSGQKLCQPATLPSNFRNLQSPTREYQQSWRTWLPPFAECSTRGTLHQSLASQGPRVHRVLLPGSQIHHHEALSKVKPIPDPSLLQLQVSHFSTDAQLHLYGNKYEIASSESHGQTVCLGFAYFAQVEEYDCLSQRNADDFLLQQAYWRIVFENW